MKTTTLTLCMLGNFDYFDVFLSFADHFQSLSPPLPPKKIIFQEYHRRDIQSGIRFGSILFAKFINRQFEFNVETRILSVLLNSKKCYVHLVNVDVLEHSIHGSNVQYFLKHLYIHSKWRTYSIGAPKPETWILSNRL